MLSKILVPLDGSQLAEAVLPYAEFLAAGLHLPVELLHVKDAETRAPALHPTRAEDYLRRTAASLAERLTVNCSAKNGTAAEVILDTASADSGILIAMATHGQSGEKRWLLGRVAQKVLQVAGNPLLLIRPQNEGSLSGGARIESIVVPLDGSRLAEEILPQVVYLASSLKVQVVLLRAYSLPTAGYFLAAHVPPPDMAELREKTKKEIENYLRGKEKELSAAGVRNVSTVVAEGGGAEETIAAAKRSPGAMVAMSTHGRSGIGRWVLGSVADRVVSYCGAPVLVIRPAAARI